MIEGLESMINGVTVSVTNYAGTPPEQLVKRALDQIIYVGDNAHPLIAEQAKAFKGNLHGILLALVHEAQKSERTTICGQLIKHGHADLADIIGRL
jgi:hypothetical protein